MLGKSALRVGFILSVVAVASFLGNPLPGGGRVITRQPVPEFHDWSTRHLVYSNWGSLSNLNLAEADPRASFSWRARLRDPDSRREPRRPVQPPHRARHATLH